MAASGFARAGGLLCILLQMVPPVRGPMASNGPISGAILVAVRRAPHFLAMALQAACARDMSTSACLLRVLLLAWSVAYRAPNSDLAFLFCGGFWVSVLLSWCWHWSRF